MSERHIKLCREAIEDPAVGPFPIRHRSEKWELYVAAHPPELLLALWECYEVLRSEVENTNGEYIPAAKRVEELTNE